MRRLIACLSVMLWALVVWAGDKPESGPAETSSLNAQPESPAIETAAQYIDRGGKLLSSRDYDRAIAAFDKALAINPKADMALASRGIAYVGKLADAKAKNDFDAALVINPRNAVVFCGRGMLALRVDGLPDAIYNFTRSLELEPHNKLALENRAQAYARSGDLDKALADSTEAIRLDTNAVEMYALRATIFRKQTKQNKAIAEVSALIAANSDNPDAHLSAGKLYASLKMSTESMQAFNQAVQLEPSETAYLTRAQYRPKNDTAGKLADVAAALRLNERSVRGLTMKATLESESGNYSAAIQAYNALLSMDKDNVMVFTNRGIAYAKNQQLALADTDFVSAREKATRPNQLNRICWEMAISGVALEQALQICDEAVAKTPNRADYLDSRAFVLLRLKRYTEAIATYGDALKLAPMQAASLYGRGIARLRIGDAPGGTADIRAAATHSPSVVATFTNYGVSP